LYRLDGAEIEAAELGNDVGGQVLPVFIDCMFFDASLFGLPGQVWTPAGDEKVIGKSVQDARGGFGVLELPASYDLQGLAFRALFCGPGDAFSVLPIPDMPDLVSNLFIGPSHQVIFAIALFSRHTN
jgi:hypothetical protein